MKNKNIVAVQLYDDMYTFKKSIYKDNKEKSGIYRLVNIITGEFYIGSSKSLYNRFTKYYSWNNLNKSSRLIDKNIVKYGYLKFKLEILEYCEPNLLLEREQFYIDLLNPKYNVYKTAGSPLGYKHTLKTKKLISNSLKNRLTNPLRIKVIDIETNTIKLFRSILEAANYLKVSERTLGRYKSNNKLLLKRYLITNNINNNKHNK
jgi:hypothetical protein